MTYVATTWQATSRKGRENERSSSNSRAFSPPLSLCIHVLSTTLPSYLPDGGSRICVYMHNSRVLSRIPPKHQPWGTFMIDRKDTGAAKITIHPPFKKNERSGNNRTRQFERIVNVDVYFVSLLFTSRRFCCLFFSQPPQHKQNLPLFHPLKSVCCGWLVCAHYPTTTQVKQQTYVYTSQGKKLVGNSNNVHAKNPVWTAWNSHLSFPRIRTSVLPPSSRLIRGLQTLPPSCSISPPPRLFSISQPMTTDPSQTAHITRLKTQHPDFWTFSSDHHLLYIFSHSFAHFLFSPPPPPNFWFTHITSRLFSVCFPAQYSTTILFSSDFAPFKNKTIL